MCNLCRLHQSPSPPFVVLVQVEHAAFFHFRSPRLKGTCCGGSGHASCCATQGSARARACSLRWRRTGRRRRRSQRARRQTWSSCKQVRPPLTLRHASSHDYCTRFFQPTWTFMLQVAPCPSGGTRLWTRSCLGAPAQASAQSSSWREHASFGKRLRPRCELPLRPRRGQPWARTFRPR